MSQTETSQGPKKRMFVCLPHMLLYLEALRWSLERPEQVPSWEYGIPDPFHIAVHPQTTR